MNQDNSRCRSRGRLNVSHALFRAALGWCMTVVAVWGCEQQTPSSASKPPVDAPTEKGAMPAASSDVPAAPAAQTGAPEAAKPQPSPELPPGHPSIDGTQANPPAGMGDPHAGMQMPNPPPPDPHSMQAGSTPASMPRVENTDLEGITLKVPEGWLAEVPDVNVQMPQLSAKAAFRLPPPEGEEKEDSAFLRVTHFPEMKGKDEMNLERWYAQLTQPDGRPTKEVSKVENFDLGEVKVLFADIPGTTKAAGVEKPDQRMLSAIINHPKGPHFVKVLGPDKTVAHWRDSVVAYLKSAKLSDAAETGAPNGE